MSRYTRRGVRRAVYRQYQADMGIARAYFWAGIVIGATVSAIVVALAYSL